MSEPMVKRETAIQWVISWSLKTLIFGALLGGGAFWLGFYLAPKKKCVSAAEWAQAQERVDTTLADIDRCVEHKIEYGGDAETSIKHCVEIFKGGLHGE